MSLKRTWSNAAGAGVILSRRQIETLKATIDNYQDEDQAQIFIREDDGRMTIWIPDEETDECARWRVGLGGTYE